MFIQRRKRYVRIFVVFDDDVRIAVLMQPGDLMREPAAVHLAVSLIDGRGSVECCSRCFSKSYRDIS